jgi:hypothetical protein
MWRLGANSARSSWIAGHGLLAIMCSIMSGSLYRYSKSEKKHSFRVSRVGHIASIKLIGKSLCKREYIGCYHIFRNPSGEDIGLVWAVSPRSKMNISWSSQFIFKMHTQFISHMKLPWQAQDMRQWEFTLNWYMRMITWWICEDVLQKHLPMIYEGDSQRTSPRFWKSSMRLAWRSI